MRDACGRALAHVVLGPEHIEAFKQKFPTSLEAVMVEQHLSLRMWFGVLVVFLYAGFRLRFGHGPKTAVIAGAALWASIGLTQLMTVHQLGLLHGGKFGVSAAWLLADYYLATLAGAWVCREP